MQHPTHCWNCTLGYTVLVRERLNDQQQGPKDRSARDDLGPSVDDL